MPSKDISFNTIGSGTRKPGVYVEFNTRSAIRNLPGNRQRTVIIGQKTAAGVLPTLKSTDVFSDVEAAQGFGYGSQLHRMVAKSLLANPYAVISVVALDDVGGAVAATWTVTVGGVPTTGGQFQITVNDDLLAVNVATTDTVTTVAASFAALINARRELPVTASAAVGVLTITAKNKGTVANANKVASAGSVTGMTLAVAAGVTGLSDPDITPALAAVFLGGHNQVVSPYRDASNLVALRSHIDNVGNAYEKRWALGYIGSNGSLASATSLSATINHGWINHPWCRNTPTAPHEIAAAYAAIIAGSEDPAMPFNNMSISGISPPQVSDRTSRVEQETALYNGVTPLAVGPGEVVQIVRGITTYVLNDAAVPDPTLLDITTPRTLAYVARVFVEDRARRYSRAKISDRKIKEIRDTGIVLLKQLEALEIIENVDANLPQYLVQRDLQDVNRINERIPADVVNGLHIIADRIDLIL